MHTPTLQRLLARTLCCPQSHVDTPEWSSQDHADYSSSSCMMSRRTLSQNDVHCECKLFVFIGEWLGGQSHCGKMVRAEVCLTSTCHSIEPVHGGPITAGHKYNHCHAKCAQAILIHRHNHPAHTQTAVHLARTMLPHRTTGISAAGQCKHILEESVTTCSSLITTSRQAMPSSCP